VGGGSGYSGYGYGGKGWSWPLLGMHLGYEADTLRATWTASLLTSPSKNATESEKAAIAAAMASNPKAPVNIIWIGLVIEMNR
jgi:hypothetical protein